MAWKGTCRESIKRKFTGNRLVKNQAGLLQQ